MNAFTSSEHSEYLARQQRINQVYREHPELSQTHWSAFPCEFKAFVGRPIKATGGRSVGPVTHGGNLPSSRRITSIIIHEH